MPYIGCEIKHVAKKNDLSRMKTGNRFGGKPKEIVKQDSK
jgi:hypothetical protein